MLKYNVRSRRLHEIVTDIRKKKLVTGPFFQRKIVWRGIHKIDFIQTILLGYPFPEIFIAKADFDVEKMESRDCVVDGQQRLNSIIDFIDNKFEVNGHKYSELSNQEKEDFLKYEIATIELDINYEDKVIIEIFKRLNRTFYALTLIEKISTEYGPTELMLLAKLIADEVKIKTEILDDQSGDLDYDHSIFNPEMPNDFFEWSSGMKVKKINELITQYGIFSEYEISRQVHLMFGLNILGTIIYGLYNRNIDLKNLENYTAPYSEKEKIINNLEKVASKILDLKLKKNSIWRNKANMFTLITTFYDNQDKIFAIPDEEIKNALEAFAENLPEDFRQASKEGVNNRKERRLRSKQVQKIIDKLTQAE